MARLERLYRFQLEDLGLAARYHPRRPGLLCAGAAQGRLFVFDHAVEDLRSGEGSRELRPTRCKLLAAHALLYALDWSCDGALCLVATSAQQVFVEDAETGATTLALIGHRSSVKTVRGCPFNAQLALSGGRDGQALLYDLRADSAPALVVASGAERVSGADFFGDERLVVTSSVGCAAVEVWDLRKALAFSRPQRAFQQRRSSHWLMSLHRGSHLDNALREVHRELRDGASPAPQLLTGYRRLRAAAALVAPQPAKDGVNCLVAGRCSSALFCSLLSHRVLRYDCENALFAAPQEFGGFRANVLARFGLDPAERFLAQGSGAALCVWDLAAGGAEPHTQLHAHALDVNCADFSPAPDLLLATVGDDCEGSVWRFLPAAQRE